jgi:hypothetical protein
MRSFYLHGVDKGQIAHAIPGSASEKEKTKSETRW